MIKGAKPQRSSGSATCSTCRGAILQPATCSSERLSCMTRVATGKASKEPPHGYCGSSDTMKCCHATALLGLTPSWQEIRAKQPVVHTKRRSLSMKRHSLHFARADAHLPEY